MEENKDLIPNIPNFRFPAKSGSILTKPLSSIGPEELNEYRSASAFMKAIAAEAMMWKQQLPEDFTPAILAILPGGMQVNVDALAQVSFHGIRVEGTFNGGPCSILTHQSTLQIMCFGQKIIEPAKRRPIGFIWPDNEVEV